MRIGDAFPSKYLKASDLPDGQFVTVSIDRVEMQNVAGNDQPEENKPCLYFVGKEKGIVLNKTNAQAVADVYGDDTDAWTGKRVMLYATTTLFQGKTVACIRVKVPKPTTAPRAATAAPKPAPVPAANPAEYGGEPGPAINDSDIPF
jgi:hypothetical protein